MTGQLALVTGAAQGIGAAIARALSAEGVRVAATDIEGPDDPARVDGGIRFYRLDVRDTAAVEETVAAIEDSLGPISILVNVAGVLRVGPALGTTDADWQAVFDVNAGGVFRLGRAVGRRMAARGSGSIITVASNAAGVARMNMAAYAASKAAAAHFTRCLGLELACSGVRCNVVSPGSTDTAMLRRTWTDGADAAATVTGHPKLFKTGIPLGRIADPDDVAAAAVFLASDRARHITMQDLCVDGGATLGA